MQLKIITMHGRRHVRPPTKGTSREGPEVVSSQQSAVSGQQSAVSGLQSAVSSQELWNFGPCHIPKATWEMIGSFVIKRRWGETVSSQQSAVSYMYIRPPTNNARDWLKRTCSIEPIIKRYRYKDRWREIEEPAIAGGEGEVCPEGNVEC
jgi:hypothetical protein